VKFIEWTSARRAGPPRQEQRPHAATLPGPSIDADVQAAHEGSEAPPVDLEWWGESQRLVDRLDQRVSETSRPGEPPGRPRPLICPPPWWCGRPSSSSCSNPLGRLLVLVFWNEARARCRARPRHRLDPPRGAREQSRARRPRGVAGTVLGFAFALLALRGGLPRWLGRVSTPSCSCPDLATSRRPSRSSCPRAAGTHLVSRVRADQCQHLRPLRHLPLGDPDVTSHRLSHPQGRHRQHRPEPRGPPSAWARRRRVFRTVTVPLPSRDRHAFLLGPPPPGRISPRPSYSRAPSFPCCPRRPFCRSPGSTTCAAGPPVLSPARPRPRHLRGAAPVDRAARRLLRDGDGQLGASPGSRASPPSPSPASACFCGAVALLVLVCYSLIAAASLVKGLGADNRLSFVHYAHVFSGGLKAVRDTLIIAVLCMPWAASSRWCWASRRAHRVFRAPRPGVCRMMNYARPAPSSASPIWSPSTTRPRSHGTAFIPRRLLRVPLQSGGPAPPRPCSRRSIPRSRSLREPGRAP